jgi:repressor LexA
MDGYRISEARMAKGWSQQRLAEELGTTQQTIQRYESGSRDVKSGTIIKLSKALGVTVAYLLGMTDNSSAPDTSLQFVDVPLYGSIAAGTPIEMIPVDDMHPIPIKVRDKHPDSFLLKVEGESMNKVLPNGCYALIEPCNEITRDNDPYAICVNGFNATIKRVKKLANGFQLVPDSTDPTYPVQTFNYNEPDTEEITVIGKVVWYCIPFDWEF